MQSQAEPREQEAATNIKPARTFFPWRAAAILALALLAAGLVTVRQVGPAPAAWYPPCPLHAMTGLWCPGCGSARVLHDLAHGSLRAACGHNILIVLSAPLILVWGITALWRGLRHNLAPPAAPTGAALIVLVVVIAFMIARNLPWWPFTLLAPA